MEHVRNERGNEIGADEVLLKIGEVADFLISP